MIIPGLTSVTFRNKAPEEVVCLAVDAGLKGIEWGGDIHVPAGYIENAIEVGILTRDSGLEVSAYGSYFTVGKSLDEGMQFSSVLDTAEALKAPIIRIWAGDRGSLGSSQEYRKKILDETLIMADEAGKRGIRLAFEFHENTLNDTYEACCQLQTELNHPEVRTYWQPIHGAGPVINGNGIDMIQHWIIGVHVFHWWPQANVRLPLQDGADHWIEYIRRLSGITSNIFGSLEFVKDSSPKQFCKDAETLLELTGFEKSNCSEIISNDNTEIN